MPSPKALTVYSTISSRFRQLFVRVFLSFDRRIRSPDAVRIEVMAAKRNRVQVCPGCGILLDPSDTHCFQCGANVAPASMPGFRLWVKRNVFLQGQVTWGIFILNFFLFFLTWLLTKDKGPLMAVEFPVLNRFGAKNTILILNGQSWRLITANFLHANLIHIFFNMWVFLDLGRYVEELYGWQRFLFFYIASGIIAYSASVFTYPAVPSIGASGAIMGLVGVLLAYSAKHWKTHGRQMGRSLLRWVAYMLVIGFLLSGTVDNAAHIGGLLGGFCIAFPFATREEKRFESFDWILGWGTIALIFYSFLAMALSK